jgi:hypothetical protein
MTQERNIWLLSICGGCVGVGKNSRLKDMLTFPHGDSHTSSSLAGFVDDCLKNNDRKPMINAEKEKIY